MDAHIAAAARGDVAEALRHLLDTLQVEGSIVPGQLHDLMTTDAPSWAWSRWAVDQAYRWMLHREDPRIPDIVRQVLARCHLDRVNSIDVSRPELIRELGNLVAGSDWICGQLAVFEEGGLADFLDVKAEAGLLDRCDQIGAWAQAPMGVYLLEDFHGPSIVMQDLVADTMVRVLNIGGLSMSEHDTVLGRVVPIAEPPYLMFESRPVPVDLMTAADAAGRMRDGDRLGWLGAVTTGLDRGRLQPGFSCGVRTLYTSDLTLAAADDATIEPGQRQQDLVARGYPDDVVNAVGVLEVALIAAEVTADSCPVVLPHVRVALTTPGAFDAALAECVEPRWGKPWRDLADCLNGALAQMCIELADRCDRPHLRAV